MAPVDLGELWLEQVPEHLNDENAIQMDDEIQLELLGPKDESGLPSTFGLPDETFQEDKSEAEQMHLHQPSHIVVPSLLDLLEVQLGWGGGRRRRTSSWANTESNFEVQYGWGGHHGPRKCRKKRTSCWGENLFGLLKPFPCCGTTLGGRNKIKRWTSRGAKNLVDGVSVFGVGKWAKVKRAYFKRSCRSKMNLKDKWRDFVRACGIQVHSKVPVRAQSATRKIIEGLEERIVFLHREHAARKRVAR